jgi:hypothetical protein
MAGAYRTFCKSTEPRCLGGLKPLAMEHLELKPVQCHLLFVALLATNKSGRLRFRCVLLSAYLLNKIG